MKHIKKLSERLTSGTYQSAANKLKSYGHKKRVVDLENWGKKRKIEEENEKIKKTIKSIESIGAYDIEFSYENYRGMFYINLDFDKGVFVDRYVDWISGDSSHLMIDISIGLVPVDDDFKETDISDYMNVNGTYWVGELSISLGELPKEMSSDEAYEIYTRDNLSPMLPHPVNPAGKMYLECWEHNFLFADRRNAARFRKSIIDIFKGVIDYKETPSQPGGLKEEIMDFLCSERPIFDINEFEIFIKSLGRTNINRFFKD